MAENPRRIVTPEERIRLARLYLSGLTLSDIAWATGWSLSAVWQACVRSGVKMRPPGTRTLPAAAARAGAVREQWRLKKARDEA
jgi:transposase-like protein